MERFAPLTSFQIVEGIRAGITPDKPGIYFDFFKEALEKSDEELKKYRMMMQEKYGLSRKGYAEVIPPGGERKLAYELGHRRMRLFELAHRHLIWQQLLMPREDFEKYRTIYSEVTGELIPIYPPEREALYERKKSEREELRR